jgi:hypothetical protein
MTVVKPPIRVQRHRFHHRWMDHHGVTRYELHLGTGWTAYCRACNWESRGSNQPHSVEMGLRHLDLWHSRDADGNRTVN